MRRLVQSLLASVLLNGLTSADSSAPPSSNALGQKLIIACGTGKLPEAIRLLKEGAPLEFHDYYNRTPLFVACFGSPAIVKWLLAQGARIDPVAKNGDTTISIACEYGQLAIAQMLIADGADLNRANQYGNTPLMLAARGGHDDSASLLIAHHADVDFCADNNSALFYAVLKDHLSTAKLLLDAGARITLRSDQSVGQNRMTLLALAAVANDLPMIDLLLDNGALINEKNGLGISPLLQAAISVSDPASLRHLIEKGADPNLADNTGQTPFIAVVENQDIPTLRYFLEHGARIDMPDNQWRTPLMNACRIGAPVQARELIEKKANVNATTLGGETALTYAGDRGDVTVVNMLKTAGATRTDLHIIAKEEEVPPLSESHRWALAVGALYAQWNGYSHGMLHEQDFKGAAVRELKNEWEVENREELLDRINGLKNGPTFRGIAAEQIRDILSKPDVRSKFLRASRMISLDVWWREKTDAAWDFCRAATLVRVGVNAGYLSEQEAWPLLMSIAHRTQSTFGSWAELANNFLDSREFEADERSGELQACAKLLLNAHDPNSPWTQYAWNTDLSAP
jgi:ankyrin repeat protein